MEKRLRCDYKKPQIPQILSGLSLSHKPVALSSSPTSPFRSPRLFISSASPTVVYLFRQPAIARTKQKPWLRRPKSPRLMPRMW